MSTEPKVGDFRFRFDYFNYGNQDDIGTFLPESGVKLELTKYRVTKVTPCGVRIVEDRWGMVSQKHRFVLERWHTWSGGGEPRRRWAYPTTDEALKSFLIRKYHQRGHLTRNLADVEQAIKLGEAKQDKYNEIDKVQEQIDANLKT